jgi:hypothetical protein
MPLLGDQAEKLALALSSSEKLEFLVEILFGPLPPRTKLEFTLFLIKNNNRYQQTNRDKKGLPKTSHQ